VNLRFVPAVILVIGALLTSSLLAQPSSSRSIVFFGRVEAVDSERKVVTVKHGKIPDYMDAATNEYSTEEDAVLKRLQPGDDIRATVHPNDLTLHQVQVVYRRMGSPNSPGR
jgi:Cu/Ag efflux protein CusF